MFITENVDPVALLTDLMRRRHFADVDTAQFKTLKHNNDLCPAFDEKVKRVLSDYEKHRVDVYDIQGFSDRGNDIVVGFSSDDGPRRVGLQIKSYDDFKAWWGNKGSTDFMDKLRSQYAQATGRGGVDTWYLVLCTDAVAHRDALRHVRAEFSGFDRVKIIDPVEALSFYRMEEVEIDTAVTQRLCANDFVLIAARKSLDELEFSAGPVALELVCRGLAGETHVTDEQVYEAIVPYANEHGVEAHDVLGALEGVVDRHEDFGYVISPQYLKAVCAVYYDQSFRFGGSEYDMLARLTLLLLEGPGEVDDDGADEAEDG